MIDSFRKYICDNCLIEKNERVLVALSGGVDSMVLAALLLKCGYEISFAHCNFHLRGEESDGDEAFVRDFAERNNVEIFVKHFDTEKFALEKSISIEMAARELRYKWFEETAHEKGFNKVAIAHHGDDQIETFFINLMRGSGIKGLKAMLPQNGLYIRPLLWSNRQQIENYAVANGIQWREDRTNSQTIYLRNKIRHQLVPLLGQIKPSARANVLNSINYLSSENNLYRSLLEAYFRQNIKVDEGDGSHFIAEKEIFKSENGVQLLFEWVRNYSFSYTQAEGISETISNGGGGVFYSNDFQFVVEKNTVEVFPCREDDETFEINFDLGRKSLNMMKPFSLNIKCFDKTPDFQINKSSLNVAQLDLDKLRFPLRLRRWKNGDRFFPLGMKGSKLISDFFNDKGFTAYKKSHAWLLCDASGKVVWIVGERLDDRFKITDNTRRVLCVKI